MTSSNGNIIRVTGYLCGEFYGDRWIHLTKPVTQSFDVFFDLHLNKCLSNNRETETPLLSLLRHCNEVILTHGTSFFNKVQPKPALWSVAPFTNMV